MDGLAATVELRRGETDKRVPIIAMTANVLAHQQEACMAAGFDEILPKPFRREQILAVLAKYRRAEGNDASQVELAPLLRMLEAGDANALEWVKTYQQELRTLLQGEHNRFNNAITNYDFDTASTILQSMRG